MKTNANISGCPSPTTASHVADDLRGRIELILDAGPTEIGIESTVLDMTVDPPAILRWGGLTQEVIEAVVGHIQPSTDGALLLRSPGTRHRYYAPRARVVLVPQGDTENLHRILQQECQLGKRVGCIVHSNPLAKTETGQFFEFSHLHSTYRRAICFVPCESLMSTVSM